MQAAPQKLTNGLGRDVLKIAEEVAAPLVNWQKGSSFRK